jgi:hypothetical protein
VNYRQHPSDAPVVVGPFQGEMNVTIAESYEKMVMAVPTMLLARTVLVSRSPEPAGSRHLTDESVTHDDERHGVTPICTSTDRSTGPKLMPLTVTCQGRRQGKTRLKHQNSRRRKAGTEQARPTEIGAAAWRVDRGVVRWSCSMTAHWAEKRKLA